MPNHVNAIVDRASRFMESGVGLCCILSLQR